MSTIKADTLSNLAGTQSVPVSTVAQGVSRAWVNFNGIGTVAIRAAFNVSSITDNGTGDYTLNFTNAMADANFAMNVTVNGNPSNTYICIGFDGSAGAAKTTSSARVGVLTTNGFGREDSPHISVSIFR